MESSSTSVAPTTRWLSVLTTCTGLASVPSGWRQHSRVREPPHRDSQSGAHVREPLQVLLEQRVALRLRLQLLWGWLAAREAAGWGGRPREALDSSAGREPGRALSRRPVASSKSGAAWGVGGGAAAANARGWAGGPGRQASGSAGARRRALDRRRGPSHPPSPSTRLHQPPQAAPPPLAVGFLATRSGARSMSRATAAVQQPSRCAPAACGRRRPAAWRDRGRGLGAWRGGALGCGRGAVWWAWPDGFGRDDLGGARRRVVNCTGVPQDGRLGMHRRVSALCAALRLRAAGTAPLSTQPSFADLLPGHCPHLSPRLAAAGVTTPTPVQRAVLPLLCAHAGPDLVIQARRTPPGRRPPFLTVCGP